MFCFKLSRPASEQWWKTCIAKYLFLIKSKPLDPIKREMALSFPSGDAKSLQSSLSRQIERKERYAKVCKIFVKRMCDLEDELDLASAESQRSAAEGTKRRRRSTTLDVDEILYTAADEAAKDLQKISEEKGLDAFIENNTLNVKGHVFSKGDKIKAMVNRDEFAGIIISVGEEDIVLKTKDYKRLKILLEDIRSTRSSIMALNESKR
ncbi:hypothetical protein J0A71_03g05240 [Encephalitozoon cuniculi]|nr:hypothetical protein J0A71_03g05240 [Encephalitozoon cuniculi]